MTALQIDETLPRGEIHREGDFTVQDLMDGSDLKSVETEEISLSCGGKIFIDIGIDWTCLSAHTVYEAGEGVLVKRDLFRYQWSEGNKLEVTRHETIDFEHDMLIEEREQRMRWRNHVR